MKSLLPSSSSTLSSSSDLPSSSAPLQLALLNVDCILTEENKLHIFEWDCADNRAAFTPYDTQDIDNLRTMHKKMLSALIDNPEIDEIIYLLPITSKKEINQWIYGIEVKLFIEELQRTGHKKLKLMLHPDLKQLFEHIRQEQGSVKRVVWIDDHQFAQKEPPLPLSPKQGSLHQYPHVDTYKTLFAQCGMSDALPIISGSELIRLTALCKQHLAAIPGIEPWLPRTYQLALADVKKKPECVIELQQTLLKQQITHVIIKQPAASQGSGSIVVDAAKDLERILTIVIKNDILAIKALNWDEHGKRALRDLCQAYVQDIGLNVIIQQFVQSKMYDKPDGKHICVYRAVIALFYQHDSLSVQLIDAYGQIASAALDIDNPEFYRINAGLITNTYIRPGDKLPELDEADEGYITEQLIQLSSSKLMALLQSGQSSGDVGKAISESTDIIAAQQLLRSRKKALNPHAFQILTEEEKQLLAERLTQAFSAFAAFLFTHSVKDLMPRVHEKNPRGNLLNAFVLLNRLTPASLNLMCLPDLSALPSWSAAKEGVAISFMYRRLASGLYLLDDRLLPSVDEIKQLKITPTSKETGATLYTLVNYFIFLGQSKDALRLFRAKPYIAALSQKLQSVCAHGKGAGHDNLRSLQKQLEAISNTIPRTQPSSKITEIGRSQRGSLVHRRGGGRHDVSPVPSSSSSSSPTSVSTRDNERFKQAAADLTQKLRHQEALRQQGKALAALPPKEREVVILRHEMTKALANPRVSHTDKQILQQKQRIMEWFWPTDPNRTYGVLNDLLDKTYALSLALMEHNPELAKRYYDACQPYLAVLKQYDRFAEHWAAWPKKIANWEARYQQAMANSLTRLQAADAFDEPLIAEIAQSMLRPASMMAQQEQSTLPREPSTSVATTLQSPSSSNSPANTRSGLTSALASTLFSPADEVAQKRQLLRECLETAQRGIAQWQAEGAVPSAERYEPLISAMFALCMALAKTNPGLSMFYFEMLAQIPSANSDLWKGQIQQYTKLLQELKVDMTSMQRIQLTEDDMSLLRLWEQTLYNMEGSGCCRSICAML